MGHFAGYFKKKEQKPIFFVKIKSLKNKRNAISTTRLVHGSGLVDFRLNWARPAHIGWKVEGPKTDHQHQ